MFYFHPDLGKIPILTNIFQMGWNHQPAKVLFCVPVKLRRDKSHSVSHVWLRLHDMSGARPDLAGNHGESPQGLAWNQKNSKP